ALPYFQRLQSKEGESGRKRLNQITRVLTVAITLVQGGGYLQLVRSIPGAVSPEVPEGLFWFSNIIILSAGTIFCMWLGERMMILENQKSPSGTSGETAPGILRTS
ncbi:MAG: hypothetical protein ACKOZV_01755, partial [Bacteroidota bacterium]